MANGKKIILHDAVYTNAFGESYSVTKLKYYISAFSIPGSSSTPVDDSFHLINAAKNDNDFELDLNAGSYDQIQFLVGVDSIHHCSGAQAGALDPINDMFWTWNSGYVTFKLEGTSPASDADLNRIEHHLGGYKGNNAVSKKISIAFPPGQKISIHPGKLSAISIAANLDNYWNFTDAVHIKDIPVCTIAGALSKKLATNLQGMFSVTAVSPSK